MQPLDRDRIDGFVRELEAGAYGLARSLTTEPDRADQIVVDAFGRLTPSLSGSVPVAELRERLASSIRSRARTESRNGEPVAAPLAVSDALHLRIVDQIEEQQNVEPIGRRRTVLLVGLGVILLSALVAVLWIRSDALAAARPTITDRNPSPGTKEVPLTGDFHVIFGRRPPGKPTLRLEPPDSALTVAVWDGRTLIVTYSGLHWAKKYQLILEADYRSRFKDAGHLEERWNFTAEGYYPVLTTIQPANGQLQVARVGQLSIGFSHRPPVDPVVTISPAGAVFQPGLWTGSGWAIFYSGLEPLTRYQATVVVDYGVRSANIRRQWTFSTEPGAPPDGIPVIWYSRSPPWNSPSDARIVALDWSGALAGTMYQLPPVQQAPDGSVVGTPGGTYVDRRGAPIAALSGNDYLIVLADDSRSVCELRSVTGSDQSWLFTGPISGAVRRVAPAGVISARSSLGVIACSVLNDRAVVVDFGMDGIAGLRVIALSTGRVVYSSTYSGSGVYIVSSRDGRYLAEETPSVDANGNPSGGSTVIRSTTNGVEVARLYARRVIRFSWDAALVVTAPFFGGPSRNEVDITDWRSGLTIWRMPGPQGTSGGEPTFALAQPGGTEMVVGVGDAGPNGAVDGLWLVQSDGRARQIASGTLYFDPGF